MSDPLPYNNTSPKNSMNNIDKLTLELLINKSQYKKYIKKNDPAKYSENQTYLAKVERYRYKIENLFSSLLENPDQQITTDIDRDFAHFIKTCIQYFELKEMENTAEDYNGDPIDDANMFVHIDETPVYETTVRGTNTENNSNIFYTKEEFAAKHEVTESAYWGKQPKSSRVYMPKYTMDSYVKKKKL